MAQYALYGAGNQSLNAEQTLKALYPDMQAKWLVENQAFDKIGRKMKTRDEELELEVITPERFAELYHTGAAGAVFVPSGYHVSTLNEIEALMQRLGVAPQDVLSIPVNTLRKPQSALCDADRRLSSLNEMVQLNHLDIHVLDYCNMNCKACSHFAPLARERGLISLERYRENLTQLKSKIPDIRDISVLGGEPLLHPELAGLLRFTRESFPYATIGLTTNGILLPELSGEVGNALRECEISIHLSLYPALYQQIDELIAVLRRNGLRWNIGRCDSFERKLFDTAWIDGAEMTRNCGHIMCLRDNRIGRCATALFADYYNEAYGTTLPADPGIDIYGPETGAELLYRLQQPLELCNQCCARDHYFEPWEKMQGSGDPRDWMIPICGKRTQVQSRK